MEINTILAIFLILLFIFAIYRAWNDSDDIRYQEDRDDLNLYDFYPQTINQKQGEIYCTFCAASFHNMEEYHAHLQNKHS